MYMYLPRPNVIILLKFMNCWSLRRKEVERSYNENYKMINRHIIKAATNLGLVALLKSKT